MRSFGPWPRQTSPRLRSAAARRGRGTSRRRFAPSSTPRPAAPPSSSPRSSRRSSGRTSITRRTSASGRRRSRSTSAAHSISLDLRGWINSGLMAFFFFVIGLEARREFDLGELRERRRVALPLLAGLGGMVVPVAIYLAINAGHDSIHGWGTAMSTDTAFALGLLALVGSGLPDRLRAYLLTVAVVDDIVALLVIAIAYSGSISVVPLLVAFGLFGCILLVRAADIHFGVVYFVLGTAVWVAFYEVRRGPGRRGPHGRRDRARLPGPAERPRARDRRLPPLPGAADGRALARPRGRRCGRPSRRTSGCSRSGIRGRATRSCRSSRSRTPAST